MIKERFGGVQARFIEACGLSRNTAAKWFGVEARVPDSRTLASIAERCGVNADWLLLGRGSMTWPQVSPGAKQELFAARWARAESDPRRETLWREAELTVLQKLGAEGFWDIAVNHMERSNELLFEIWQMSELLRS